MTKNDAIERALDRLTLAEVGRRTILTDLAAEIERPLLQRIARMEREGFGDRARLASLEQASDAITAAHLDAEARLAAVEDYIYRYKGQCASEPELIRHLGPLMDILAVARGEGGEQAPREAAAGHVNSEETGTPMPAAPDAPQITMHAWEPDESGYECKHCGHMARAEVHGETGRRPVAAGHIDWRAWVNERAMDSLDADMEGGDFIRVGEVLELAELLIRAEAKLYTDSQVGPEHPRHGNTSRDDVTKPQQSPASDGGLDEIVRDCFDSLNPMACGDPQNDMDYIRAAFVRARETDPKLAAVRAWRDKWRGCLKLWDELDAILDGKEAEDR